MPSQASSRCDVLVAGVRPGSKKLEAARAAGQMKIAGELAGDEEDRIVDAAAIREYTRDRASP